MRRALADNLRLDNADIPWSPPKVLPSSADLREGIATLKELLTPAPRPHILFCYGTLLSSFEPNVKAEPAKAQMRAEAWIEATGDIPADLWTLATKEALRSFKFMPRPVEIRALIDNRLTERRNFLARAERMLSVSGPKDAPFVEDTEEVKLRTILKWKKAANKWAEAAPLEIRLAKLEGREPESWVLDGGARNMSPVISDRPPLPEPSPRMRAATLRAAARNHEKDRPAYAALLNRQADLIDPPTIPAGSHAHPAAPVPAQADAEPVYDAGADE